MLCVLVKDVEAGNQDRQGEAGALQLLLNPWARSAGFHAMNTSFCTGVEAMRLNVAGLARINKTELLVANTRYLEGTDIFFNSGGVAQKVGKNGTFGLSLMSINVGDIMVTTTDQPEGTGATYSPRLFNMGISYAHMFENKISVGVTFRTVSEATTDVTAFGFAIDAGVQYVTGPQDNFRFGISLRNIGSPMTFKGQGLSESRPAPDANYPVTYFQRAQKFELPSVLNIGLSYDFIVNTKNRVTVGANFTSNSFSRDNIGAMVEYSFNDLFMLRAGYKYEMGDLGVDDLEAPVHTGIAAGLSLNVPLKKGSENRFGIDYAYLVTQPFGGTHNIGVRITL